MLQMIIGTAVAATAFICIWFVSHQTATVSAKEVFKGFKEPTTYKELTALSWVPLQSFLQVLSIGNFVATVVMGLGFGCFFVQEIALLLPVLGEIPVLGHLLKGPGFLIVWWALTLGLQLWWFYTLFGQKKLGNSRLPRWLATTFLGAMSLVSFVSGLWISGLLFAIHTGLAILVSMYQEALIKANPGV